MVFKLFDFKSALVELTVILVGVVGIIKDVYALRQRYKVLLTFMVKHSNSLRGFGEARYVVSIFSEELS